MKVCVTSSGAELNAQIDPRFGRCRLFLFVDTESMETRVVQNTSAAAGGGAGTGAAQMVADAGAEAVLTGNVGPNAYQALSAAGISIYTGLSGTCRSAVDAFKAGGLQAVSAPTVDSHAGMGSRW